MSKHYIVTSPEYGEVVPVLDYGQGPLEYTCCVVDVEADNARDAKLQAIGSPEFQEWVHTARGDGRNPFVGLKAEPYECEHGCPVCCDPNE